MLEADNASVAPDAASSSVILSVAPVTAPVPWLFSIVPETVTDLSGESVSSSSAVIVHRPRTRRVPRRDGQRRSRQR